MTPHKHWFRSYSAHVVPIRVANGTIIYSAGIGMWWSLYQSCKGRPSRSIVFHDVLHVPDL
ncbi:hypothetical protein FISHEDRAFT_22557, partial [Fistulina hepatica ATCC 64428]